MRFPAPLAALLFSLTALFGATPAAADVDVTFYSREFGAKFPHAFFTMKGELSNGDKVDTNFGFTAQNVSPAVLFGSVLGEVSTVSEKYRAASDPHFTVTLDDAGYAKLLAVVKKWRNIPQKSYSLNKRNCVHFIADALNVLGYRTDPKLKYKKKPTSFMKQVMKLNPGLK